MISLKTEVYKETPIVSLRFSYKINKGPAPDKLIDPNIPFQTYYNNKLPITIDPKGFGEIIDHEANKWTIGLNDKSFIILEEFKDTSSLPYNLVKLFKNNRIMFTWKDYITSENSFQRELGKSIYHFSRDSIDSPFRLELHQVAKTTPFISKINTEGLINNNFITMDIETISVNNSLSVYLICWYDGKLYKSYWAKDFKDLNQLVDIMMKDLCINKYKNHKIFLHNFSGFDGIFLLKALTKIGECKVIQREGKILSLQFKGKNNIVLTFRDSYLLLPSSLKELGNSFNSLVSKELFPIKLNDITYSGPVPDFSLFPKNTTEKDYINYVSFYTINNKIWSFKEEAINYCINDCVSLYQVLIKFNQLNFNKFKLNIQNYPTLPSLAFTIFRAHYLLDNQIPCLVNDVYLDISESYTGGAVDMFIPINDYKNEEFVYEYDINGLYPSTMYNFVMPVGLPKYFEGDIYKLEKDPFGFFYCEVITPQKLEHPIIQIHHKTKNGMRTVAPLGKFQGMFFSEEIKNAKELGYIFKVIKGYTFDKSLIFEQYVNDLYNLRLNYPKTDPLNYIAKLLLNSLYGRFGMSQTFDTVKIIKITEINKYLKKALQHQIEISNIIEMDNNMLISYSNKNIKSNYVPNINIAIASSITSYARIHMSQYKNNPNFKLFYTDTDSAFTDRPLPNNLVSNTELGKMKLVSVNSKAVFLAPKVYALRDINGKETIKIKGLTKEGTIINNITIDTLESLLIKDSVIEAQQNKWFKSIKDSNITIKESLYSLKVTGNKRELIYENGKLTNTKPLIINTLTDSNNVDSKE